MLLRYYCWAARSRRTFHVDSCSSAHPVLWRSKCLCFVGNFYIYFSLKYSFMTALTHISNTGKINIETQVWTASKNVMEKYLKILCNLSIRQMSLLIYSLATDWVSWTMSNVLLPAHHVFWGRAAGLWMKLSALIVNLSSDEGDS